MCDKPKQTEVGMNENSQVEQQLVDVNEMARILDVPKSWIYQRTRPGLERLPLLRAGKYLRFDTQEVIAFLRNGGRIHP